MPKFQHVFMRAPLAMDGGTITCEGRAYELDAQGIVEVANEHISTLTRHGFELLSPTP